MTFFEEHPECDGPQQAKLPDVDAAPSAQNDLTGECAFCGAWSDDVIFGVCADCSEEP